MKKKLIATLAIALSAMTITACSTTSKPTFTPNWQSNVLSKEFKGTTETLVYDVTFEKTAFLQKDYYTVEYCGQDNSVPGTYTTKLEFLDDGTYKYSTDLSATVTYTMTNDPASQAVFTDSVKTEVIFHQTGKFLQPISSKKTVHCYSPKNAAATELKYAYTEFNYEFFIEYNEDLTQGTLTRTDYSNPRTLLSSSRYPDGVAQLSFEIDQKKYLYLDNEQLLLALRALSNKELASAKKLLSYNASMLTVDSFSTTPGTAAKTNFELALNGEEAKSYAIDYTPVTLKNEGKNATLTQELWYAQTTESTTNKYRNVLLKMVTPIHYNIGRLTYSLRSATFSNEL